MAVKRREVTGKDGTQHLTNEYHYRFMYQGHLYYGVCENCFTKADAEKFEKALKDTIKKGAMQETQKALIENFREELSGGTKIALKDAFSLMLQKPVSKVPSPRQIQNKRAVWNDFVAFLHNTAPEIELLSDVRRTHAESYIGYIRTNGRFKKEVVYERGGKSIATVLKTELSSRTQNFYHTALSEVFDKLFKDAGLLENPFDFSKTKLHSETREPFSQAEIDLILAKADDFVRPLFVIALATALREGDICTLKWENIDFDAEVLRKQMRKTGHLVEIPISPIIEDFRRWHENNTSEYVFPQQAEMYLKNRCGISYRIKEFLESIGIKTTKKVDGRKRMVSIKDLHSCRHTFCYSAGMNGIPQPTVQAIVGHMTPEMTRLYSAHATLEDKRDAINRMRDPDNADRLKLIELIKKMPIEKVHKLLSLYGK